VTKSIASTKISRKSDDQNLYTYSLFGKAENAITRSEKEFHGVDEPLILSILLKADRGVGWVIRGKTWHRGSCVMDIV
jgi:hypothetical protein